MNDDMTGCVTRLQERMQQLPDEVELYEPIYLAWSLKGVGFGELRFYEKDGSIHCMNEYMSKDRIKEILCAMVDQSILDEIYFGRGVNE